MTDIEYRNFESLFNDKLRERGFTLKRLSELSNIAINHLENLSQGKFEHLPPAPYLRGYLTRLAPILGFDADLWWERLKTGNFVRSSGGEDELPKNRFAKKSRSRSIWIGGVVLVIAIYLGIRFSKVVGAPEVVISFPDQSLVRVETNDVTVRGRLTNGDILTINKEVVRVADDGSWEKDVSLQPGLNTVEISAKKFLGRESKIVRQILYEPIMMSVPTSTSPR